MIDILPVIQQKHDGNPGGLVTGWRRSNGKIALMFIKFGTLVDEQNNGSVNFRSKLVLNAHITK